MSTVDVVIPFRDYKKSVKSCVDSLLTNSSVQKIFLVQNGVKSEENVEETRQKISKEFDDPRIKFMFIYEKGASAALNSVISISSADFILFASSHSYFEEKYTDTLLKRIGNDEGVAVIGGRTVCVPSSETKTSLAVRDAFSSYFACFNRYRSLPKKDMIIENNIVYGAMYRREYLIKIGMFDIKKERGQDFDVVNRLVKEGWKSYVIPIIDVYWVLKENTPIDLYRRYKLQAKWSVINREKNQEY